MDNQRVTNRLVKDALLHIKRCPFALQKGIFYYLKGHILKTEKDFLLHIK